MSRSRACRLATRCVGWLGFHCAAAAALVPTQPAPLPTADQSIAALVLPPGFRIETVAAEPLIVHPVAIDWGPDGRLWVADNAVPGTPDDDADTRAGGRIRWLADTDRDGRFDQARLFADGLPAIGGIMAWERGLLICAGSDLIYAEDTDGDGEADRAQRLLVGFSAGPHGAPPGHLALGLDGWIYGAAGGAGGTIRSLATPNPSRAALAGPDVTIDASDFRWRPATGQFERAAGSSQAGRVRDDFDLWFGADLDEALCEYRLPLHYARRNPAVPEPQTDLPTLRGSLSNRWAAVGFTVYRDTLCGEDYYGNVFACDPAKHRVWRGVIPAETAAAATAPTEFVGSANPWFTPRQVRTGPDGALWLVDSMTPDDSQPTSAPATPGAGPGRIYRISRLGTALRPILDLTALDGRKLAQALDTPNGTTRDLVQQEFIRRGDTSAVPTLLQLCRPAARPRPIHGLVVCVQAMSILDGMGQLPEKRLTALLSDPDPIVRSHAIRLSEPLLRSSDQLPPAFRILADDSDARVRFQLALSLGESADREAGAVLAELLTRHDADSGLAAAALSSAGACPIELLAALLATDLDRRRPAEPVVRTVVRTALALDDPASFTRLLEMIGAALPGAPGVDPTRMTAAASLLEALHASDGDPLLDASSPRRYRRAIAALQPLLDAARKVTDDRQQPESLQAAALPLLGWQPGRRSNDLAKLEFVVLESPSGILRQSALKSLLSNAGAAEGAQWLAHWPQFRPSLRPALLRPFLTQPEWTARLLRAIDQGYVAATEVTPANRDRLLHHPDPALRREAAAVFSSNLPPVRAEVLARYRAAAGGKGDPANGRRLFELNCATCHSFRGTGHPVGPDLASIGRRTAPELLDSIVAPNATVEPRFVSYEVETRAGDVYSGVLASETDRFLAIRPSGGRETPIPFDQVAQIRASNYSLMPDGIEAGMTVDEMRDLLSFLLAPDMAAATQ